MTDNFPWYKRDARAAYEGTRCLSLEARGAYTDILDLIYIHNGPLPDDPKWMSHALFVSVRKWKSLRSDLISERKIECFEGKITNFRATLELEKRATQSRTVRETSVKQSRTNSENSEKPNKNSKIEGTDLDKKKEEKEGEVKGARTLSKYDIAKAQLIALEEASGKVQ